MGCASCKPNNQSRSNVISYPAVNGITFFENASESGVTPNSRNETPNSRNDTINYDDNINIVPTKVLVSTHSGPDEIVPADVILYWTASRKTERYHWWPLLDKKTEEEDYINNLFAKGGGIYKYGMLCDNLALLYQKEYHRIPCDSKRTDKNWAGFCDRAASLSCLYSYPRKPVTVKYGPRQIEFMPADIEALMICASDNAIRRGKTVLYGKRNNTKKEDIKKIGADKHKLIKSDPLPLDLLDILHSLTKELIPFVMDVDNGEAVWNYPFDSVKVTLEAVAKYKKYLPNQGNNKVYRFILESSSYPEKNMDFIGYVNRDYNFVDQGWIGDNNPDFLWRQYPQIGPWLGKSEMNPFVNSYHVYRIYLQSISKENKIIKLTPEYSSS